MSSSEPKRIRVTSSSSMQLRPRIESSPTDDVPRRKSVRIISRASISPEPEIIRVRRLTAVPAATEPTPPGTNPQANASNPPNPQANGSNPLDPQANGSNPLNPQGNGSNRLSHHVNGSSTSSRPSVPSNVDSVSIARATRVPSIGDRVGGDPVSGRSAEDSRLIGNSVSRVSTEDSRVRGDLVGGHSVTSGLEGLGRAEVIERLMSAARAALYGTRDQPSLLRDMSIARRDQVFSFLSRLFEMMADDPDANAELINMHLIGFATGMMPLPTGDSLQRFSQQHRPHILHRGHIGGRQQGAEAGDSQQRGPERGQIGDSQQRAETGGSLQRAHIRGSLQRSPQRGHIGDSQQRAETSGSLQRGPRRGHIGDSQQRGPQRGHTGSQTSSGEFESRQRGRASVSAHVAQRRVDVRAFFASTEPIDLSQSPRAMSISSESTERTLSSDADSWSSSSEGDWSPRPDPLVTSTQPIIENRDDESNLLNQPQLLHFIKHHTGRVKCSVCDDRIRGDQIRLDYRPGFRSAAVRHVHIACAPSNRDLFFPTRGVELVSFGDGFTEEDRGEFLNTLRSTLPPQVSLPGQRGRLFPVVRNGDALELSRVALNNQRRALESHRHYMRARAMAGGPLFMSTFGGNSFAGHMAPSRGLDPAVLASLPRVTITPTEPGQDCDEEHSCVICLEPMLPRQDIVMLPCFHRYHETCISTWLKNSRQCPMDKMDVGNLLRDGGSSQAIPSSFI